MSTTHRTNAETPASTNARTRVSLSHRRGFTLVEILIVVVILGVLAALVIPSFASAVVGSEQQAFVSSLRAIESASNGHFAKHGVYPSDSSSGEIPEGLEEFLDPNDFTNGTPIGGVWDFERDSWGFDSSFGVHFNGTGPTRDEAYMLAIDEMFDDGDLESGEFQQLSNDRYYFILDF